MARGERDAAAELLPLVYDELRLLADARLRGLPAGQTLQATALVHEAWLKLGGPEPRQWEGRRHYFGAAARAMRNILVDAVRRARGRGRSSPLETAIAAPEGAPLPDLVALDEALRRLERDFERPAQIVMLRYFAGLSVPEVGEVLGISPRTVDREWAFARAFLANALAE